MTNPSEEPKPESQSKLDPDLVLRQVRGAREQLTEEELNTPPPKPKGWEPPRTREFRIGVDAVLSQTEGAAERNEGSDEVEHDPHGDHADR
jgi:hypothetical protein